MSRSIIYFTHSNVKVNNISYPFKYKCQGQYLVTSMLFLLILGLYLNQGNTNKYNYTPVILLKESENMSTKKKSICPILIVLKCYFRCRMSEHNDLQLIYLNHDRYHYCYEGSVGILIFN